MNRKIKIMAVSLLALFAAGCANEVTSPDGVADRSIYYRLKSWENVRLTWASMRWTETATSFKVVVLGSSLLRNLAYQKDVAIRYTTNGWKSWSEIKARYSSSAADNCEYWTFESPEYSFSKSCATQPLTEAVRLNFDFVVRYRVNGVTYWDNNGGRNYHIDQNLRYISN